MKTWYASKTLWVNLVAIIALIAQSQFGYVISPEIQATILGAVNLLLRAITGAPLAWSNTPSDNSIAHIGGPGSGEAGFINLRCLAELFLVAALIAALAGCATTGGTSATSKDTPLQIAGKSLLTAQSAIVATANATNALCKTGVMPVDKCVQAKAAYEMSKPAYDTALDAYLLMSVQGGDPAAFGAALVRLQDIAANLLLITGGQPQGQPLPIGGGVK